MCHPGVTFLIVGLNDEKGDVGTSLRSSMPRAEAFDAAF
jgi:hypothetical protein